MKPVDYLAQELQRIEQQKDSFIGMDGGNINEGLWFCGVEFGSNLEEMEEYYKDYIKYYDNKNYKVPYRTDCPRRFINSNFDRILTALYLNLFNINEYPSKEMIDEVLKNELYNKTSKSFKLNIFPFAKSDIFWKKEFEEKLSLKKEEYYISLFKKRASFIKKIVAEFKPETILCFSPKNHADYFVDAFYNPDESLEYRRDSLTLTKGRIAKIKIFDNGKFRVIVLPFLGRQHLASYEDVRVVSNYIKDKYNLSQN